MRISLQAVEELRLLLRTYPLRLSLADYEREGLSFRRWVFDHIWAVPHAQRAPWMDARYAEGCNDDHIFTALKAAIAKEQNLVS